MEENRDWVFQTYSNGRRRLTKADVGKLMTRVGQLLPTEMIDGLIETSPGGEIVIGLVDRPEALWQRLNNAMTHAGFARAANEKMEPRELHKRLDGVRAAADELLRRLEYRAGPDVRNEWEMLNRELWDAIAPRTVLESNAPGAVRDAVDAVAKLRRWADEAAKDCEPKITKSKNRNKGDMELKALFGALVGIWLEVWQGQLSDKAASPFRRFCNEVLSHAGLQLTDQQVRYQIQRWTKRKRKLVVSKNQLRNSSDF